MDLSGVYKLEDKVIKFLLVVILGSVVCGIIGGVLWVRRSQAKSEPTQQVTVTQAPATCIWIREAHHEDEKNPGAVYNCWSSADGDWEGYVQEMQNGDWFDAHSPSSDDEHANKSSSYGTMAQAQAAVEQKWHAEEHK